MLLKWFLEECPHSRHRQGSVRQSGQTWCPLWSGYMNASDQPSHLRIINSGGVLFSTLQQNMSVDIINKKRTVDWNVYVAQRRILLIYAIFWSMIIVCLGYIWSFLCCVITVHGPQRINPTDFDDPPTFQVAPPKGWHIQYIVKYLNNYYYIMTLYITILTIMFCTDVHDPQMTSPKESQMTPWLFS